MENSTKKTNSQTKRKLNLLGIFFLYVVIIVEIFSTTVSIALTLVSHVGKDRMICQTIGINAKLYDDRDSLFWKSKMKEVAVDVNFRGQLGRELEDNVRRGWQQLGHTDDIDEYSERYHRRKEMIYLRNNY